MMRSVVMTAPGEFGYGEVAKPVPAEN